MANFNMQDFIEKYGAQAAIAATVPDVARLLEQAMAEGWTQDKFIAEFMNTAWFRSNAESFRSAAIARTADPAEFDASKKKLVEKIQRQAIKNGVIVDAGDADRLAESLLDEYWGRSVPDDVLDARLGAVTAMSRVFGGKTMSAADSLRQMAYSMGVKFDPSYFDAAAKSIVAGASTIEQWEQSIKDAAKSRFPMFAAQIDAGMTVDQVTSPYKQTMSALLELPVGSIGLDDPMLSRAFGSVDKDGKPSVMGLWDFEKSLRNDPRWGFTKNARAELDSVGRKVLQDFGLAY